MSKVDAWLKRECEEAEREIAKWPDWMRVAAQFEERALLSGDKPQGKAQQSKRRKGDGR